MRLLDVRIIRRPPRYIQTRYTGQVLLNANEYPLAGIPTIGDMRTHVNVPNIVIDNTDADLHGPETYVIKTVSHIADQRSLSSIVERYYIASNRKRDARLFRILYANNDRTYTNNRVLLSRDKQHYLDPFAHLILSYAKLYMRSEELADLYLDAVVWTRCCETWFSPTPLLANLLYLNQTIQSMIGDHMLRQPPLQEFMTLLRESPNYKSIKPTDYISLQHEQRTHIPISEIMSGYTGPLIDSSPCPSLYPSSIDASHVNNLQVFGPSIERLLEYRLTDLCVKARFPKGETSCIRPSYVEYLVDRTMYDINAVNNVFIVGGLSESELDGMFKQYCHFHHLPVMPHDTIMTLTRTYDEEVTIRFDVEGLPPEIFYFDLNACTLLSPDACVNRIAHTTPFPLLDARDVSNWS